MTDDADFGRFSSAFCKYFDLDGRVVEYDSHLVDDLAFDSIMILECWDMLEDVAGHPLHDGAIDSMRTVGDVFNLFQQFTHVSERSAP